jgi:hypothetical protein
MDKDKALKLALEALEEAHYKMEHYQDEKKREQAITAIKQALAAPVQELLQPVWNNLPSNKDVEDAMRIKRLNQLTTPPAAPDLQAELVKANAQAEHFEREWYLRGDELEATNRQVEILSDALAESRREIAALKAVQEPVAWMPITEPYPPGAELDILMGDGSILCDVLPQADGDLWWDGSGTGEKFIDPQYTNVTHWRIHSDTAPPAAQRQWFGLDDTDIGDEYVRFEIQGGYNRFEYAVRAIEAKLRSKNA